MRSNVSGRNRIILFFGLLLLLLVVASFIASRVQEWNAKYDSEIEATSAPSQDSVAGTVFREIRTSISDITWLKTEEYMHDGIQHIHLEEDEEAHEGEDRHEHEEHVISSEEQGKMFSLTDEERCEHSKSLIPSSEIDFRGILGDIERWTQPYSGEHVHSKNPEEILPWLRVTVLSNPHHIRAHRGIAFFLAEYLAKPEVAIDSVHDALKLNPNQPQLLMVLGRLHFYSQKNRGAARKKFEEVIDLWENREQDDEWNDHDSFAVEQCYIHAAYCCKLSGDLNGAISYCRKGLESFPDSTFIGPYLAKLLSSSISGTQNG